VVEVDNDGVIISVSEGSAAFRESAGVAFYPGILIPGLSDLMSGKGDSPHWQYSRGIRVAGTSVFPEGAGNAGNSQYNHIPCFKITEDPCVAVDSKGSPPKVSEGDMPDDRGDLPRNVTPGNRQDNLNDLSRTVSSGNLSDNRRDIPRKGNYGYQLAAERYIWKGMYGEVVDYVVFDGMDHFKRYFMAGRHAGMYQALSDSGEIPVLATGGRIDMLGLMVELQKGPAQISFQALLEMASINGALAAGYEKTTGSLSTGKQPGLCIIEGADIANMRLLQGSRLRRLL
jgi:hypothetical protein